MYFFVGFAQQLYAFIVADLELLIGFLLRVKGGFDFGGAQRELVVFFLKICIIQLILRRLFGVCFVFARQSGKGNTKGVALIFKLRNFACQEGNLLVARFGVLFERFVFACKLGVFICKKRVFACGFFVFLCKRLERFGGLNRAVFQFLDHAAQTTDFGQIFLIGGFERLNGRFEVRFLFGILTELVFRAVKLLADTLNIGVQTDVLFIQKSKLSQSLLVLLILFLNCLIQRFDLNV